MLALARFIVRVVQPSLDLLVKHRPRSVGQSVILLLLQAVCRLGLRRLPRRAASLVSYRAPSSLDRFNLPLALAHFVQITRVAAAVFIFIARKLATLEQFVERLVGPCHLAPIVAAPARGNRLTPWGVSRVPIRAPIVAREVRAILRRSRRFAGEPGRIGRLSASAWRRACGPTYASAAKAHAAFSGASAESVVGARSGRCCRATHAEVHAGLLSASSVIVI